MATRATRAIVVMTLLRLTIEGRRTAQQIAREQAQTQEPEEVTDHA